MEHKFELILLVFLNIVLLGHCEKNQFLPLDHESIKILFEPLFGMP